MNHQPFENWILDDRKLTPQEQGLLDEHIQSCDSCRKLSKGWNTASRLLRTSPIVPPEPGFSQRWESYFNVRREAEQRRTATLIFSAISLVALLLFIPLNSDLIPFNQSPLQLLTAVMVNLLGYAASFIDFNESLLVFLQTIPFWIPILVSMILTFLVTVWIGIWLIAVWKTPKIQRSES